LSILLLEHTSIAIWKIGIHHTIILINEYDIIILDRVFGKKIVKVKTKCTEEKKY